ncbi:MAG: hypothetical protein ACYSUM_10425 [Planctomycetota bacterium]
MKAPSPAFSFYPKDILSDEAAAAMTDEELGIYIRLLCHAWLEGSIPADPARLARMTRRPRPAFDKLWKAIAPCWRVSSESGRLIQGRLELEREKQRAYSAKQRARGKHGGRPRGSRSESTKAESRGKAAEKPEETRAKAGESLPSPSPSPSPSPTTITENDPVGLKPDDPLLDAALEVFQYWRLAVGKPGSVRTRKREQTLMARLREEPGDIAAKIAGLKLAVDGALRDPWYNGTDRPPLLGFQNIFVHEGRDRIEKLQQSAREPPRARVPATGASRVDARVEGLMQKAADASRRELPRGEDP